MLDVCRHCCVLLFIPAMILSGVCCCAVCADCFLHSSSMLDRCWWWLFLQLDGPLPPVSHVWYTYMYHSTNLVSFSYHKVLSDRRLLPKLSVSHEARQYSQKAGRDHGTYPLTITYCKRQNFGGQKNFGDFV